MRKAYGSLSSPRRRQYLVMFDLWNHLEQELLGFGIVDRRLVVCTGKGLNGVPRIPE